MKVKISKCSAAKDPKDSLVKKKNNQGAITDAHPTALPAFGGKKKLIRNWKYEKPLKKLLLQWYVVLYIGKLFASVRIREPVYFRFNFLYFFK